MPRRGGPRWRGMEVPGFVGKAISNGCPSWWKKGCGGDKVFSKCADVLQVITPVIDQFGKLIWIFGSPLAFPLIFCFSPNPHTNESSGYEISMLQAPFKRPCSCCFATVCGPCFQWHLRRKVLGGDMTKYKLWQGYHDGPHCMARTCPSMPCTIKSGTYGEQDCPNAFLCLEVWFLGGCYSSCCSFDVSRRYQRHERGLSIDPTENRQRKCIHFFSRIMHTCCKVGCCVCVSSCLLRLCAPESEGAQELGGEGGRAARACFGIARTLMKGILWTRVIGNGCMSAQMIHEAETPWEGPGHKKRPEMMIRDSPKSAKMADRGRGLPEEADDEAKTEKAEDSDDEDDSVEITDMRMPWEKKQGTATTAAAPRKNRMDRGVV